MQTIGERLEEARKRKGVTIREAAEATKIRGDYLNSFENNNFTINVPDIYVRGFLRSYANFLKLNSDKVLTDYNATLIGEAKAAKRDHREFFGRMELQQPLIGENPPSGTAASEELEKEEASHEAPSGGSLRDFLDGLDKEIMIKVGIIAVVALLAIVSLLLIFNKVTANDPSLAGDQPPASSTGVIPTTAGSDNNVQPAVQSEPIRLYATGDVRVSVTERNTGRVLLDLHPMTDGQSVEVTRQGPVRIDYTAGENLEVEIRGKRYQTGKSGEGYSTIR